MSCVRVTGLVTVLALIFVLPARSNGQPAPPALDIQGSVQQIAQQLAELNSNLREIKASLAKSTELGGEGIAPPTPPPVMEATAPLGGALAGPKPPAGSLGLEQKILDHYQKNIEGAKSRATNKRPAVEAILKAIRDARGRLSSVTEPIDADTQERMLAQLRNDIHTFFQDHKASETDWRTFLEGIPRESKQSLDPTLKSNWEAVLAELESGFVKVAAEIQKDAFKNGLKLNQGVTPNRAQERSPDESSSRYSGFGRAHHFRSERVHHTQ